MKKTLFVEALDVDGDVGMRCGAVSGLAVAIISPAAYAPIFQNDAGGGGAAIPASVNVGGIVNPQDLGKVVAGYIGAIPQLTHTAVSAGPYGAVGFQQVCRSA